MKIERVPLSELHVDPANARHHSAKNLEAIKGSLARFGQQGPIIVDAHGVCVAGNGRLLAARALGWTHLEVVRTDLGDVDRVAFALADNRTSELATWDPEALAVHLRALQDEDFDVSEIGWDEGDLKIPDFQPASANDQGTLDQLKPVSVTCPGCGESFELNKEELY